jgi:hypothetical protein
MIYKSDPLYTNNKDNLGVVSKALQEYQDSGSLKGLQDLEKKKIIANWQLYDWVAAADDYMKTGKLDKLEAWMKTFYVDSIVDELFNKNPDVVKKLFGSKKGVNAILGSFRKYCDYPKYTGYQKGGGFKVQ